MEWIGREEPPENLIVIVPGYMGSKLRSRSTGELVWLDVQSLLKDPFQIQSRLISLFDQMKYPNDDLVPDGIMDEIVFIPPFIKQEHYGRLINTLVNWGYSLSIFEPSKLRMYLFVFSYDWRQDNRISARKLAEIIRFYKQIRPDMKIWMVGHSNGGIVARWFIEKEGGKYLVDRLFLLASPWDGAPKSMQVLLEGPDIFFLKLFNQFGIQKIFRETALTFPSFYQLIPGYIPFLQDQNGENVDVFRDYRWLSTSEQRQLLADARIFSQQLGTELSVETLCFFGIKQPTVSRGTVKLSNSGNILGIEWKMDEEGDGTVPLHSAVHLNAAQKLPYSTGHGNIYVHPGLLDKLKYEFIDRFRFGELAAVSTPRIKVHFYTDRDTYCPGETISVFADAAFTVSSLPIYDLKVEVSLCQAEFIESHPYASSVQHRIEKQQIKLEESSDISGRYEGRLIAPDMVGYFYINAVITSKFDRPIECHELILIESE